MPCRSDYMEATNLEIELAKVFQLIDELNGKNWKEFGDGYDKRVYGNASQEKLDVKTEELCSKLQEINPKNFYIYSLELQMWWRDHQKTDGERVRKELEDKKTEKDRQKALLKLSPYEKRLLNL